ncbi:hypothetical protein AB1K70_01980 [Bremerella sp. JC770]|uniref:TadE/TadG family type IV pilus assembly protein n=1 Tax=Bremerella sp. JC770 TaxID=3232137 RepID=UPI0034580DE7
MMQLNRRFDFLSKRARRGVSLLWIIIAFPALILFLVFAVEIGNIWLARIELEQSLEANALAAVKQWQGTGGGDTEDARMVGNAFSIANPVRGQQVNLTDTMLNTAFGIENLNYNPSMPNGNAVCTDISEYDDFDQEGVLVFGAITQTSNLVDPSQSVVFRTGVPPSCTPVIQGGAPLLFDVTGPPNGNLGNSGLTNTWGVSFGLDGNGTSSDLRITLIEIDVDPEQSNTRVFNDFSIGMGQNAYGIISEGSIFPDPTPLPSVPDNFFRSNHLTSTEVNFDLKETSPGPFDESVLQITFGANASKELLTGERFRFGAQVRENPNSPVGADQVGQGTATSRTRITVYYENTSGSQPPLVAYLDDTTDLQSGCQDIFSGPDALSQYHYTGHPQRIADLPCPHTGGSTQNGQSYVLTSIGGVTNYNHFAVRAQATIGVKSVVQSICGFTLGPWGVSAKATAYYDCVDGEPRLIHVDDFRCN